MRVWYLLERWECEKRRMSMRGGPSAIEISKSSACYMRHSLGAKDK